MNAKEILYKKCEEKGGCFLAGQVGWIVEAMQEFAAQKEPTIIRGQVHVREGETIEQVMRSEKKLRNYE